MGVLFKINEELASIAVTSTELLSVSKTTLQYIKNKEFIRQYAAILLEINRAYSVLDGLFSPFCALDTEDRFLKEFDTVFKTYKDCYLMEISKPRKYYDNVYEAYVAMQQTKEANTAFPLIKNNFVRLNDLYDKWINNDAYLAMSIDRAVKLENNLLIDIATQKEKDMEDAFILFKSAFDDFSDYLYIIRKNTNKINSIFENN